MGAVAGGSRPYVEILVNNNATTGISSKEVDTGGDKITVPMRIGLTAKVLRIVEIIAQDEALIRLRCF